MTKRKLKFGTIADPIETWDTEAETTFFFLKELTKRGYESWVMSLNDLSAQGSTLIARAQKVRVTQTRKVFSYKITDQKELNLKNLHCLFLRKDPPVDLEYLTHLTLLELLEESPPLCKGRPGGVDPGGNSKSTSPSPSLQRRGGLLMINSPSGIKKANEKTYPFYFNGISPPSMVSKNKEALLQFLKKFKKVVRKPLNGAGGKGIFIIGHKDADALSLLETATNDFTEFAYLQKFLPESKKGDKRILLLNGEPVGAFLRIPSKKDFRGNMHSGARWVSSKVSSHEKKVLGQIKPQLLADGLYFVGVDFIGSHITEINTTSPMGIREINHYDNSHVEKLTLNWVESRIQA